jgi:hypothetical protein
MVARFISHYRAKIPKPKRRCSKRTSREYLTVYLLKRVSKPYFQSGWWLIFVLWQLVIHLTWDLWHLPLTSTEPAIEFSLGHKPFYQLFGEASCTAPAPAPRVTIVLLSGVNHTEHLNCSSASSSVSSCRSRSCAGARYSVGAGAGQSGTKRAEAKIVSTMQQIRFC